MTNRQMTLSEFATRGMIAQSAADKLCRTNDPQTSKDAAKRIVDSGELNEQEKTVYTAIRQYVRCYKSSDFTTKDIALWMPSANWDKEYAICKRRFSGLFNKFKICLTGERRDNCRVWKLL